ncbi:hypothetical protein [Actinopolyspora mortivallis]|uniref:hypothetical protein n=1 Tax=Actinopolyspora mortivallis TaxID=33906 RepID=UPI0012EE888F|nr:hypothetical protein [Actinopolyspora mortivallis]
MHPDPNRSQHRRASTEHRTESTSPFRIPSAGFPAPQEHTRSPSSAVEGLNRLEHIAEQGESDQVLALARTELHRLTEGLRALLEEHLPDAHGRCRVCPGGLRGRRWPCGVWSTAYTELVDELPEGTRSTPETPARRRGGSRDDQPRPRAPIPSVPVVRETIVSSGVHAPGHWDTGELSLRKDPSPAHGELTASLPPLGGHLETNHSRIHRAGVAEHTLRRPRRG